MTNKHVFEKDLKTINGESIVGSGNLEIVPEVTIEQNIDASTLTEEQLDYLRDKQIKYGSWSVPSPFISNFVVTPQVTKLPIFNTKNIGNLTASNETTFLLKKDRVYKIEVSLAFNGSNSNNVRFGVYNDNTNNVIGDINLIQPPTNTANLLYESFISLYVREDADTPISVRMFNNYGGLTNYTISSLTTGTKINITEISSFDVSLKNFKINGKSFDENNNIDLEGLSTLSSPKLNVEILTERRHPISGKPLYTKTIDFGALPNNTLKSVSYNVSNIDWVSADLDNSYVIDENNNKHTLLSIDRRCFATTTSITLASTNNQTNRSAIVTVQYTKTTNTAESPVRLVGGGFKYVESDIEPDNPSLGDEWHNTTNDILYKRRKKNGILDWYEI